MLLAVEGGGFFSSSASGYRKGLMLLVLKRDKVERPMRVAPWDQYQLVEQKSNHKQQLATRKGRASSRGCAPFVCFRRASAGLDGPPPPKVGHISHSETLPDTSSSDSDQGRSCNSIQGIDGSERNLCIKSNLKKPSTNHAMIISGGDNASGTVEEGQNNIVSCTERRKVQWTDSCGGELVQIREFEARY